MELSYCIVNTNGRERLLAGLDAIAATHPAGVEAEILVLDNASGDDSVAAASEWIAAAQGTPPARLIALQRPQGQAANDSILLREAKGALCLLLNEDSELRPGASEALLAALAERPQTAAAGAQLLDPSGRPQPCAWRLPGLGTAFASALFLHRFLVVQGEADRTTEVGWVQSAAMLVRREAVARIGYFDPEFFVYSDETDLCKRLRDAGWEIVHVPAAEAVHHEQLARDLARERPRIVEFHRGRDRYMRKHHGRVSAAIARVLSAWTYMPRALAALFLPSHSPRRYLMHARAALFPGRGEGLREAAERWNAQLRRLR